MSGVFDVAKQTFLGSGATRLDVDTDTIKCRLVDKTTDYTAYDSTNTSMTPIPKYGASTDQTLANPSIVTASAVVAFDNTADLTFTAVAVSGTKTVGALVIYKFVSNDAGSTPIVFIDGFTAVTPNGGNITVVFAGSPNYIFSL